MNNMDELKEIILAMGADAYSSLIGHPVNRETWTDECGDPFTLEMAILFLKREAQIARKLSQQVKLLKGNYDHAVALLREHGIPFEEKYPVNLGYRV